MIKRIVISALVLLVAYALVLKVLPADLDSDQSQWSTNVIKARDYILSKEDFETVLVGTSLSTRIVTDSLGENIANLSFSGSTVWDGLQLIAAREQQPKRVLIESTFLFKKTDGSLARYVSEGFNAKLKSKLPVLREKNQPVGILKGLVTKAIKGENPLPVYDSTEVVINPEILELQAEYFEHDYTAENYEWVFTKKLLWAIEDLRKNGVEIVFYEMPVHPQFCEKLVVHKTRQHLEQIAEDENIRLITTTDCQNYQTNDGIHLIPHSGLKFTKELRKYL
ncbi:hypothetical protein [Jiulongibacter sp. NS-SX5]|uniref:hypothetical protein n=1 Tax=Jiulongibacter sp. NS-SX5 TaxID=3463854 RepID=UPI004059308B